MREVKARSRRPSRREVLRYLASAGACLPLGLLPKLGWAIPGDLQQSNQPASTGQVTGGTAARLAQQPGVTSKYQLTASDDAFLEELQRANFLFFWEQTNPATGIVKDRCNVRANDNKVVGSIAATGFGLTALCIGENRGYISYAQARDRALVTLRFLWKKLHNQRGFFYHWANINTGERLWESEISSIDTAILLCGVLTCRQHFVHSEVNDLAQEIFNRVNWQWLSEDTLILPHGWAPETGFLRYRWDSYSELMMLYLLGLGSSTFPLPPGSWDAWKRSEFEYDGIKYIGSFAPIFVHQYSLGWFDFRAQARQVRRLLSEFDAGHRGAHAVLPGPVESNSPTTARIFGASPLRIRSTDTRCGAGRRKLGRSTARWCRARRRARCRFFPSR